MKKYRKVTDMEVLEKYFTAQGFCYSRGIWQDYFSAEFMANILDTSKYQIQKAYKRLTEQGYMKLDKVCTHEVPVLYAKAYVLTDKARDMLREKAGERGRE
jgi:hypothetical protein